MFLNTDKEKCFINICTNENLDRPKSTPSHQGNKKGIQWSIPHSSSEGRKDVDAVSKQYYSNYSYLNNLSPTHVKK